MEGPVFHDVRPERRLERRLSSVWLVREIPVYCSQSTTSVPNGNSLLPVVASDAPSNSPVTALTGAIESDLARPGRNQNEMDTPIGTARGQPPEAERRHGGSFRG